MKNPSIFVDTSFVYALINPRDQWHETATKWRHILTADNRTLLTTQFILAEVMDGLASLAFREAAVNSINTLSTIPGTRIIPATSALFDEAVKLFRSRADKAWGFTDCSSFVTMNDFGLTEALTSDDDFRQAGFRALMLE